LITDHTAYLGLGRTNEERHQAYRGLVRDQLDPARLQEIRTSLNQCRVLGNERFKDEIEAALSRAGAACEGGSAKNKDGVESRNSSLTPISLFRENG